MKSSYPAADFDPRLTKEARLALPVIAAIQKYQKAHLGALPPNLDVIRNDLPHETDLRDEMTHGWRYVPDGEHFRLYRKLGWDPALFYETQNGQPVWTFDPGDGSPEKTLKLNP